MENILLDHPNKFFEFLQQINSNTDNAKKAAEEAKIIAIVLKNINKMPEWHQLNSTTRQSTLNLAFRTYKKIVLKNNLENEVNFCSMNEKISEMKEINFDILYAFLQQTDVNISTAKLIFELCLKGLSECQASQEFLILTILRSINLLIKKQPTLELECSNHIKLTQIYAYLQMNQHGIREDALNFFSNCCKSAEAARKYFQFILNYYPWTHRNKYLLLSCILQSNHNLNDLLVHAGESDDDNFFNGLRLSLAYKRLLSPSQYLVKALSTQESLGLLNLSATILTVGTCKEISNFYANWFNRIIQKETLLKLLYEQLKVEGENLHKYFTNFKNEVEEYRFVLIFCMYGRQIQQKSGPDFNCISSLLITNSFVYQIETQLLIYKFVVNNLNCFKLENNLIYLTKFINEHKNIENAQIRNNILSKISTIINFVAKNFRKMHKELNGYGTENLTSFKKNICDFFKNLNQLIEIDIESKIYQPKIFALKLLEVLLKSLFQEKLEKNAKNCIVSENEALGKFLITSNVFDSNKITLKLIEALNDPTGFDDALDLIVELLKRMPTDAAALSTIAIENLLATTQKCCENVDIDVCNLSLRYAVVALNQSLSHGGHDKAAANYLTLQKYALNQLHMLLVSFKKDPLNTCKTQCHIFGLINVLNVTISSKLVTFDSTDFEKILELLELIVNLILELLLRSAPTTSQHKGEAPVAASFQDMDESLEILVKNSQFEANNHEECRKFLLMSFWLTLKACCDAATTLGTFFADCESDEIDCEKLQRCFNIHISVLTRCRHKGAIEAAGVSIGKLTKHVTARKTQLPSINQILCNALSLLFQNENLVSTTRRGAGFSIMFLHIVKNDEQTNQPILRHAMQENFKLLKRTSTTQSLPKNLEKNCDRIEALSLHYLCVLSKDAELREAVAPYRNEIILAAIKKIDDPEWTICNAALQLFGAVIPKIVGQKQANEVEAEFAAVCWEPAVMTFAELAKILPETFEYILNYCRAHANESRFTRSIILFLGFLSKLEHLAHDDDDDISHVDNLLFRLRELMWSLLQHREEKVRKLAALVFVRAHEFRCELPQVLINSANLLFSVSNENFFEGLIFVIQAGNLKIRNEALYTITSSNLADFMHSLHSILRENFKLKTELKFYTQTKLLEMLLGIGFDIQSLVVINLLKCLQNKTMESNFSSNFDELLKQLEIKLN